MPILEVHLVDGMHTPAQHTQLLESMSRRYAEVLDSPLDRVRAYLRVVPAVRTAALTVSRALAARVG